MSYTFVSNLIERLVKEENECSRVLGAVGKDSCLACYKAMKSGYRVGYLLNFISNQYKRCCFHGIEADLLDLQAELTGIPLIQKEVSSDMEKYETEFKEAVSEIKPKGIQGMVFGDIYLNVALKRQLGMLPKLYQAVSFTCYIG